MTKSIHARALAFAMAIKTLSSTHPEHAATIADELVGLLESASPAPAEERSAEPIRTPDRDPTGGDRSQLALFDDHLRASVGSDRDHHPDPHTDRTGDRDHHPDPHTDRDHSSSSDQDLNQERQKRDRVTLDLDAPLEPTFERIYNEVQAARGVELPAVGIVWGAFCEVTVERRWSWASRGGLRRRWRQWLQFERPQVETLPAPVAESPVRAPRPGLAYVRVDAELELQELERAPHAVAVAAAARLASLFTPIPKSRSA